MKALYIIFSLWALSLDACCCRKRARVQPAPVQQPQPQPVDPLPTDPIRRIKHLRIRSIVD